MTTNPSGPVWWGRFNLSVNSALGWRVGPFELRAKRLHQEWLFLHSEQTEGAKAQPDVVAAEPVELSGDGDALRRFVTGDTDAALTLTPRLADRPVVVRPQVPFSIAPGAQAQVFISSPLWLEVGLENVLPPLMDIPLVRPSDTWFGANTLVGELCYASRTFARADAADLPVQPHHAITPIRLHNQAADPLRIETLSLPAPYLSLYADAAGGLWTQNVTLRRRPGESTAELELGKGAPAEAQSGSQVSGPRMAGGQNLVVRAWSSLFSR